MKRHAFLVMAHDEYELLAVLVQLLDDPRADIYIHVDRRSPSPPPLAELARHSRVTFIRRRAVRWSGYSQVEAEMDLIAAATPGRYLYYHLLSGHDLPITPRDKLYSFFELHEGTEFVDCWATPENGRFTDVYRDRIRYFTPIEPRHRRSILSRVLNRASVAIQRGVGVDRTDGQSYVYGSNWFSITHDLAEYCLRHRPQVRQMFHHTRGADEIFLQTLTWRSEFRSRLHPADAEHGALGNARYIDWSRRGEEKYSPYVIRASDVEGVRQSGCMFARKFSLSVDSEAIEQVARIVRGQEEQHT